MPNWLIIQNDTIVDAIVSDSQEYVEQTFSAEVLPDDGIKGIGWTRTSGAWQAPYPTDGLEYTWDLEFNNWVPVPLTISEETFIVEE